MSEKNDKKSQSEGVKEVYPIPRPAFLNLPIEFAASHMVQFSFGAMLLFPILTAFTAGLWAVGASSSTMDGIGLPLFSIF